MGPCHEDELVRERPPAEEAGAADAAPAPDPAAPGRGAETAAPATPGDAGADADAMAAVKVDSEPTAPAEPSVEEQRDQYLALAQRTQADFENFRKRAARDVAGATARAKTGLLRELLPVVDNLERALAAAGPAEQGLVTGVSLVHSDLLGLLQRSGVTAIEPAGERFDPSVHEALSTAPADGAEPGLVVQVVQKGYALGETVIRPARVVVSA